MQPITFSDVLQAVLMGNVATLMIAFGLVRLWKIGDWDWWSAGAILIAVAMVLPFLYFKV